MSDTPSRESLLQQLRPLYIPTRVQHVEPEFLQIEEDLSRIEDLQKLLTLPQSSMMNKHNSSLMYVLGITDEYNPRERVNIVGGSVADYL